MKGRFIWKDWRRLHLVKIEFMVELQRSKIDIFRILFSVIVLNDHQFFIDENLIGYQNRMADSNFNTIMFTKCLFQSLKINCLFRCYELIKLSSFILWLWEIQFAHIFSTKFSYRTALELIKYICVEDLLYILFVIYSESK